VISKEKQLLSYILCIGTKHIPFVCIVKFCFVLNAQTFALESIFVCVEIKILKKDKIISAFFSFTHFVIKQLKNKQALVL